ncbi:MAG: phosphoribosyltransferase [Haloarculaceae archaeon]
MFTDRTDAGERLAAALADAGVAADLVLAIPRGGLPVGRAVADRLGAPLSVVVASKMGAPSNPELAVGAVAEDGTAWLNEGLIAELGVPDEYVERTREAEAAVAREKAERYRGGPPPEMADKRVVVVDDGVATGATMRACLARVRAADPARLVVAVPVGPADTAAELADLADEVVFVETPVAFRAVGAYYRDFGQVSDEAAMAYLE